VVCLLFEDGIVEVRNSSMLVPIGIFENYYRKRLGIVRGQNEEAESSLLSMGLALVYGICTRLWSVLWILRIYTLGEPELP